MITVVCVGTGTEVGKTWVGAHVLTALHDAGVRVAARKPVQSFDPDDDRPTDADVLAAATDEAAEKVCPAHHRYELAMAPPVAAIQLGRDIGSIAEIVAELAVHDVDADVLWVETVGGVRSPLAADGESADLALALHPDLVVLVANAGLGAINAVRLSAGPFPDDLLHVILNRYDDIELVHQTNAEWLRADGYRVSVDVDELVATIAGVAARASGHSGGSGAMEPVPRGDTGPSA